MTLSKSIHGTRGFSRSVPPKVRLAEGVDVTKRPSEVQLAINSRKPLHEIEDLLDWLENSAKKSQFPSASHD